MANRMSKGFKALKAKRTCSEKLLGAEFPSSPPKYDISDVVTVPKFSPGKGRIVGIEWAPGNRRTVVGLGWAYYVTKHPSDTQDSLFIIVQEEDLLRWQQAT